MRQHSAHRDHWIWYPYLERPFPWLGLLIFGSPLLVVVAAAVFLR